MNYGKKIGLGTWKMAEVKSKEKSEIESIQRGIELGLNLIDTAEMYADGKSETLVGKAIANYKREDLYIVSKVYPFNAGKNKIFNSCEKSLERLGTDYLDLYLLHWPGDVPIAETVECMEELRKKSLIKEWGVSNFTTEKMKELLSVPNGKNCATNQVLYHLGSRGIEYSLVPFMKKNNMKIMAYSPIAQAGKLNEDLFNNNVLSGIAKKHDISIYQLLLSFVIKRDGIIAIPKAGTVKHVEENFKMLDFILPDEDYDIIDKEFPAPDHETYLDVV